ncbi:MAG: AAA family ATPase [Anaerolineae bacterium]|nr:AAA family ATPase [Anaerolineae bacterium]
MQYAITDDLDALLQVLPPTIRTALVTNNDREDLLEIVLDLGRPAEARYVEREVSLTADEVTQEDIDYVVARIGDFGEDNRAGIERTLHRISAIRNRKGRIVGLTMRVGRAISGTVDIIKDIVQSGQSVLLLGRPGVGKTTLLREVSRVLSETRRVVIVDTSNEIGGDGDIPHPAVGHSRRMQVPTPMLQHEVMIEAVENHMPQVIVIDEIGREQEAEAARTIAERGVQLIGTAHGQTLANLMNNPTLADLVGGIQTVTLSDEEARRRGTQKSVLERMAPPTFDVVVEIQDWEHLTVHPNVSEAVDAMLRGKPMTAELRYRDDDGEVHTQKATMAAPSRQSRSQGAAPRGELREDLEEVEEALPPSRGAFRDGERPTRSVRVFPYGISQNRLRQAAKSLQLPVLLVDSLRDADVLLTLKSYYRKRMQPITEAEQTGIPVYVLRTNTVVQIESALADVFGLEVRPDPFDLAMREAQSAIDEILRGSRSMVELRPQNSFIRRAQHELARSAKLQSLSSGDEPRRRVRIYRNGR